MKRSNWVHKDYADDLEFGNIQLAMRFRIFANLLHFFVDRKIPITHEIIERLERVANERAKVAAKTELYSSPIPPE